ncbi:hypothetical protein HZH68_011674 [Vespula germanica]|uniref:Uncharacterized protein n=1 Tax=Vespula germanica TaxID=30212 RepID=A0A834JMI0_VESGE|nr:hypothetical protein HZH68_011674 [Vespula germanica]
MQLPPSGKTWAIDVAWDCILRYKASTIEQTAAYFGTFQKIKWSGGDTLPLVKRYKAADFGSGSSLATNFNEFKSRSSQYVRSRSKREELIIQYCGGDTLARVK